MRKIFVTGGAGFIGSTFIRLILAETNDVEIINFDLLTYAKFLITLRGEIIKYIIHSALNSFVDGSAFRAL